jgi:hypothetical protein
VPPQLTWRHAVDGGVDIPIDLSEDFFFARFLFKLHCFSHAFPCCPFPSSHYTRIASLVAFFLESLILGIPLW